MRLLLAVSTVALLAFPNGPHAQAPKAPSPAPARQNNDAVLYSLGVRTARQLGQFGLSPAELEITRR